MTIQAEIREGLIDEMLSGIEFVSEAHRIDARRNAGNRADKYLRFLRDKDVVIKGNTLGTSHPHLANYFTVEPLIEEK